MLVGIIHFPKIKQGKDKDFVKWFDWSNSEFMKFDGFISRKLLRSTTDHNYLAILEIKDEQAYMRMHKSHIHKIAFAQLIEMLDGITKKSFYNLAIPQEKNDGFTKILNKT